MLEQRAKDHIIARSPHALILAMPPGTGKTFRMVKTAEWCASQGMRVLVLGPRRDFFGDVIAFADHPEWWYDWLPRQEGDDTGKLRTCLYVPEMTIWLNKGHEAMDFCSNGKICGWNYIKQGIDEVAKGIPLSSCRGCVYHAQKSLKQPIVYGRHQHLTMGHPLMDEFDVIIGDELPLAAFLHHWVIGKTHIAPTGMDKYDPFTEIVHELARFATEGTNAQGPDLMTLLGGAEHVLAACEGWQVRLDEQFIKPNLRSASAVEDAPYFHLLSLGKLLHREAQAAQTQSNYPHRVSIHDGKLHLLLRRTINDKALGKPMIWLDATANEHLYKAMFAPIPVEVVTPHIRLTGKVYQIWNRSNNKSSFTTDEGGLSVDSKDNRPKLQQVLLQVKRIVETGNYTRPLIVTYKDLVPWFTDEGYEATHFYGARGTNRYEGCDAVIVIGTPQPNIQDVEKAARMLYFGRMEPFNAEWSERDVLYQGQPFSYPISGFWNDPDLQAMLWQQREAELTQSAHRVRPLWRKVDVWLMTNIPLDGVPPDKLLTINDLFDAPGSVDPYEWPKLIELANDRYDADLPLTSADVATALGVTAPTAREWLKKMIERFPDRWQYPPPDYIMPRKRGKPPVTAVPFKD